MLVPMLGLGCLAQHVIWRFHLSIYMYISVGTNSSYCMDCIDKPIQMHGHMVSHLQMQVLLIQSVGSACSPFMASHN